MYAPYLIAYNSADGRQEYAVEQNNVSYENAYDGEYQPDYDTDCQNKAV
jgi:hypothetical protein